MAQAKFVKQADAAFRKHMHGVWQDIGGYIKCASCKHWKHPRFIEVGHIFARSYGATRWLEANVRPQCRPCNQKSGGEDLKTLLDSDVIDELRTLAHDPGYRLTDAECLEVINRYA